MVSRSKSLSAVLLSGITCVAVAQVPNQAQPAPPPTNNVNPANPPVANPNNNPNLANNGVAGTNQNLNGAGVVTTNQPNNPTALNGSGILNALGIGALSEDMMVRLQNDAMNRKQVTLTGRIMDAQSFFLGEILGSTNPALVGQPISAGNGNANPNTAANRTVQNAAGTGAPAGVPVNPNVAGQNQNQVAPGAQPGNVANPANNVTANNQTGLAVSDLGQLMVLQTNSSTMLVARDPLARTLIVLTPTATPVTVQGRVYERKGMRLLLVSAINAAPGTGTGTNSNNPGTINNPNNSNKGAGSGTNRSTR